MPAGSCFCGDVKIEYTGEPVRTALCHCGDCRKISGGNYSNNILVKSSDFKVTEGKPAQYAKVADSGRRITSNFCQKCGTTLFRHNDLPEDAPGLIIIKAGVLDDADVINQLKPGAELYAPARVSWIPAVEGAGQVDGMPPTLG